MVNITDVAKIPEAPGIGWKAFLPALSVYLVGLLLSFVRWQVLLKGYKVNSSFKRSSLIYLASYAVFSFTPLGRLGSEGFRVTMLLKETGSNGVIASVAYERLLDGFLILGLFLGWIIAIVFDLDPLYTSIGFMILIPAYLAIRGSVSTFSVRVERWIGRLPKLGIYIKKLIRFSDPDKIAEPPRKIQLYSALITIGMWLLNLAHIAILLEAFNISNPLIGAPAVLLVEMLGLGLPIPIPAGLGIMDFLTAITLKAAGLNTSFVGQYLVVERVIITVIPGILGLFSTLQLGIRLAWRRKTVLPQRIQNTDV